MSTIKNPGTLQTSEVKQCCASLYESDVAKLLLGESFHPGGLKVTERLGQLLRLGPGCQVLDVASGNGASAIFLAERFGCEVIGIDYGAQNVEQASAEVAGKRLDHLVRFQQADAESLPFRDGIFDAVVCECAFCTFPDKERAAHEFARVLRDGGRVGLSDLTRSSDVAEELQSLLAWVACIADAQPLEQYLHYLVSAGLAVQMTELHDDALIAMVRQIQGKLLGTEIMAGLKKLDVSGFDFTAAKQMAKATLSAIDRGQLGYAVIIADNSQNAVTTPDSSRMQ